MEQQYNVTIMDDFDYSVIDTLSMKEKIEILKFIAFAGNVEEPDFSKTQFEILTHLSYQRLVNPGFMPFQLSPENWKR